MTKGERVTDRAGEKKKDKRKREGRRQEKKRENCGTVRMDRMRKK